MAGRRRERSIDIEAVFEYEEGDESVGIYAGYLFLGFQDGKVFVDGDDIVEIRKWAEKKAQDLAEDDMIGEED